MYTVVNAQIVNAEVSMGGRLEGLALNVTFEFDGCYNACSFNFCASEAFSKAVKDLDKAAFYEESMKALALMNYTGVYSVDQMVGKNVRIVLESPVLSGNLIGLGHPTDDNRFFRVRGDFETISMEEIVR